MVRVTVESSALSRTKWHEYVSRFLFGGIVTVLAWLIDRHWGPYLGGMFLAFPGIFPCGVSMVESHAREHKKEAGLHGTTRGRQEASLEAVGASAGAVGLAAFGAIVWWGATRYSLGIVLPTASVCWGAVSFALWWAREHF